MKNKRSGKQQPTDLTNERIHQQEAGLSAYTKTDHFPSSLISRFLFHFCSPLVYIHQLSKLDGFWIVSDAQASENFYKINFSSQKNSYL